MSNLRRIHAMRREVGFQTDDDWRDMLERVTGGRSSKGLSIAQSNAVVAELRRLGASGKGSSKGARKTLTGPYAKKLQALWLSCWNMGLVGSNTDAALITFAKRQTGIEHASWIRTAEHALPVIEALKAMLGRAGVNWGPLQPLPGSEWIEEPQARVAMAQFRSLSMAPELAGRSFQQWVRGEYDMRPADMTSSDWVIVITRLGKMVRYAKSGGYQ